MRWRPNIALGGMVVAAMVATTGFAHAAGVVVHLGSSLATVAPGDTFEVRANVPVTGSAFNAFELVVRFDPAMVTFIPTTPQSGQVGSLMTGACGSNFHVFNAYGDSTVGDVSLLCAGTTVTGPGRIYQLKFRANAVSGVTTFTVGVTTRFYNAGIFVNPVDRGGCLVRIGTPTSVEDPSRAMGFVLEAPRPNPSRGGAGATIGFALPVPGRVSLELFDPLGRRVAGRELGETPAGSTRVRWTPDLPPGRYELRLRADGAVVARRTWVLLR